MMSLYEVITLIHILFVIITVGAVTVVDYLHLVGLRQKKLEQHLRNIYPRLSDLINGALIFVILTGLLLLYLNKTLLQSPLFLTKFSLVLLVTANGLYLQHKVTPILDLCVVRGRKYCTQKVLYSSAFSGAFSITTWYAIVILSITKTAGYTACKFLIVYTLTLILAMLTALLFEKRSRKWYG